MRSHLSLCLSSLHCVTFSHDILFVRCWAHLIFHGTGCHDMRAALSVAGMLSGRQSSMVVVVFCHFGPLSGKQLPIDRPAFPSTFFPTLHTLPV